MGENDTAGARSHLLLFITRTSTGCSGCGNRNGARPTRLDIIGGYPGTNSECDNQGRLPGVPPNTWLTLETPLNLFSRAVDGTTKSTRRLDCINIEKQLNPPYSAGSFQEGPRAMAAAPGRSRKVVHVSGSTALRSRVRSLLPCTPRLTARGTWSASTAVLSRWAVAGCANCQTHLDVKSAFSLSHLPEALVNRATFEVKVVVKKSSNRQVSGIQRRCTAKKPARIEGAVNMASGNFNAAVVATPPAHRSQPVLPGAAGHTGQRVGVCPVRRRIARADGRDGPASGAGVSHGERRSSSWSGQGAVDGFRAARGSGCRSNSCGRPGPSDGAYLGTFSPDQSSLAGRISLAQLPAGNAGVPITSDFSFQNCWRIEALRCSHEFLKVPPSMLWQTVIALNVHQGLRSLLAGPRLRADRSLLVLTAQSLPERRHRPCSPGRRRPRRRRISSRDTTAANPDPALRYFICNMGMFLEGSRTRVRSRRLAPVRATPFFTGIVGSPTGTDYDGAAVGGGGVTSFAFNLHSTSRRERRCGRRWLRSASGRSRTSIGTSSAFFAENAREPDRRMESRTPAKLAETLLECADEILEMDRAALRRADPAACEVIRPAPRPR